MKKADGKLRIGIDLLPLNTQSYYRGIGKYTFNLVTHIVEIDNDNIYYLFDTPAELIGRFNKKNVVVSYERPTMEDIKELDIFHITSLFEVDKDILMPSKLSCKIIVTFYDLIPAIFWDNYIEPMEDKYKIEYFRRLGYLKSVDSILAISKTTKNDLIELLDIPGHKIKVIYGSIDKVYETMSPIDSTGRAKVRQKYNIDREFILCTPAMDFRKNIYGLFKAFYHLSDKIRKNLSMVLVCKLSEEEENGLRNQWKCLGLPNVQLVLTNYIPVEDLVQLYDSAEMFVFPSLYEGLGIPVLEAMSRGCPVITSNNSSLPEICESAAIYTDPYDPREIASAIEKLYHDNDTISKMKYIGLRQQKKFSWKITAFNTLECYGVLKSSIDEKFAPNFIFRKDTMDKSVFDSVVNLNEYHIPDKLNSDDIIIDIGAHIGSFSYLCLERGSRHILAFEMCEPNCELIKRNLSEWIKKRSVHVFEYAVWKSNDEYVRYISSTDPTNTGGGGIGEGNILVKTISLDAILKSVENVKLLKIDAEGSEYSIFLSAKNISKIEYICGEYHGGISAYKILEDCLQQNGFDCTFEMHEQDPKLSLFFAKRKDLDGQFFKDISFNKI